MLNPSFLIHDKWSWIKVVQFSSPFSIILWTVKKRFGLHMKLFQLAQNKANNRAGKHTTGLSLVWFQDKHNMVLAFSDLQLQLLLLFSPLLQVNFVGQTFLVSKILNLCTKSWQAKQRERERISIIRLLVRPLWAMM